MDFKKGMITSLTTLLLACVSCSDSDTEEIILHERVEAKVAQKIEPEKPVQITKPECRSKITTQEFEGILGMGILYSDSARVNIVAEHLDNLGFQGWVKATGGPSFDCLGDKVPVSDERIMWAINFYKKNNRFDAAAELAVDAGSAKGKGKFFQLAREIYLEIARDPKMHGWRNQAYINASRYANISYEENVKIAEEAMPIFMNSMSHHEGKDLLETLLPDITEYIGEDKVKRKLQIPKDIKRKKEDWIKKLAASSDNYEYESKESDYELKHSSRDPCEELFLQGGLEWHELVRMNLNDLRKKPENTCSTEQMLKAYEAARWFKHAIQLAASKGMDNRVKLYQRLDDLRLTAGESTDWRGELK